MSLVTKNYAGGKDKLVFWLTSHCGLLRDDYVLKLSKYLNVTIYGKCAEKVEFGNRTEKCTPGSEVCKKEIKRHKFYLSFENCFCQDYITEKYWLNALEYDLVPIVLGANYDGIAIPGSFIHVSKFRSIKSLADHLIYLDKNETAYNEYFGWKRGYKKSGFMSMCQVCEKINQNNESVKIYHSITDFWSKETNCDVFSEKVKDLQKQIKEIS